MQKKDLTVNKCWQSHYGTSIQTSLEAKNVVSLSVSVFNIFNSLVLFTEYMISALHRVTGTENLKLLHPRQFNLRTIVTC